MAMSKKLYNLMDWAEIEAVTYSEEDHPKAVLGAHPVRGGMTLITTYMPKAKSVTLKIKGSKSMHKMELADEEGYFAVLVNNKDHFDYSFIAENTDGTSTEVQDAYAFEGTINKRDIQKLSSGIHYKAYSILGAKVMEINGIKGTHFAVWAPNAVRVSVVGDFNEWDGRIHQMERLWETGVFELFVPGVEEGALYKYEIKKHNGTVMMKSDPYGFASELRPGTASIVYDIEKYAWNDDEWIEKRGKIQNESAPISVYEVNLASFDKRDSGDGFFNYRELAPKIEKYVKDMGYTHIELMPVMEHMLDESLGYQTSGFYAPTSRYGTPDDFMYFVDYMHKNDIGVILDWSPAKFPKGESGLESFDGTCLYEDPDSRRSAYPEFGNLYFNLSRPEVKNYLIANALFWISQYHADGLRLDSVSEMLYLDYGKKDGEWIPNIYGGKENLDSIEFFKHLNSVFRKLSDDVLIIAEERSAWQNVTGNVDEDGLGFDYKWNTGWLNDVLGYMKYDPLYRSAHYNEVCFPMIYQYSEKYILPLSHNCVMNGEGSLIGRMSGDADEKYSNMRAMMSYYMFHPGKKLLFMGQDLAEEKEWDGRRTVEWDLLKQKNNKQFNMCMKELLRLYRSEPALYEKENVPEGFEWINNISANENIVVFIRKSSQNSDILLAVANFESVPRKEYKIGVPEKGKYTEIFNSDKEEYGGFGFVNARPVSSKAEECDGREQSIRIKVAPMAVSLFRFTGEK